MQALNARPWNHRIVWQHKAATGASSCHYYVIDNPCRGDFCVFLASFENNSNANVLGSDWYVKASWMPIWAFGNVGISTGQNLSLYWERWIFRFGIFPSNRRCLFCLVYNGLCLTFKQVTQWIMKLYLHKM